MIQFARTVALEEALASYRILEDLLVKSGVWARVGAEPGVESRSPYPNQGGSTVVESLASWSQFSFPTTRKAFLNCMNSLEDWRQTTNYLLGLMCHCRRKLQATLSRVGLKGL